VKRKQKKAVEFIGPEIYETFKNRLQMLLQENNLKESDFAYLAVIRDCPSSEISVFEKTELPIIRKVFQQFVVHSYMAVKRHIMFTF
jgi:hypothetical protein